MSSIDINGATRTVEEQVLTCINNLVMDTNCTYAECYGSIKKLILAFGLDVNVEYETPYIETDCIYGSESFFSMFCTWESYNGEAEGLDLMLWSIDQAGADVARLHRDDHGRYQTCYHMASSSSKLMALLRHKRVRQLLPIDTPNKEGETALQYFAKLGEHHFDGDILLEIAMIECGANTDCLDASYPADARLIEYANQRKAIRETIVALLGILRRFKFNINMRRELGQLIWAHRWLELNDDYDLPHELMTSKEILFLQSHGFLSPSLLQFWKGNK